MSGGDAMPNYPTDPLKGIGDQNLITQAKIVQENISKHLMVRGNENSKGSHQTGAGQKIKNGIGAAVYIIGGLSVWAAVSLCVWTRGCSPKDMDRLERSIERKVDNWKADKITISGYEYAQDKNGNYFCEELAGYYTLPWYNAKNQCFYNEITKKYDIPLYLSSDPDHFVMNPKTRRYERYKDSEPNKNQKKKKQGSNLDNNWKQMNKFAVRLTEHNIKTRPAFAVKQNTSPRLFFASSK